MNLIKRISLNADLSQPHWVCFQPDGGTITITLWAYEELQGTCIIVTSLFTKVILSSEVNFITVISAVKNLYYTEPSLNTMWRFCFHLKS